MTVHPATLAVLVAVVVVAIVVLTVLVVRYRRRVHELEPTVDDGPTRPVPGIIPETDEDRRRLREAEIRRSHRLARRAAIEAGRG